MSNGDVSPKYGARSISHVCEFDEPISRIKLVQESKRLVGIVFYTQRGGEYMHISSPLEKPTSEV